MSDAVVLEKARSTPRRQQRKNNGPKPEQITDTESTAQTAPVAEAESTPEPEPEAEPSETEPVVQSETPVPSEPVAEAESPDQAEPPTTAGVAEPSEPPLAVVSEKAPAARRQGRKQKSGAAETEAAVETEAAAPAAEAEPEVKAEPAPQPEPPKRAEPAAKPKPPQVARLFDARWYSARYSVAASDAYEHYLKVGIAKGASPSPLFDPTYYAAQNVGVDFRTVNPIEHYLKTEIDKRVDPHPLFDRKFYIASGPELPPGVDPFLHLLSEPESFTRPPHPLFDSLFYLENNQDVARNAVLPLRHFVVHGGREARRPHPLFDMHWYRQKYRDTAGWDNALLHYLAVGVVNGCAPHPLFDPDWYLSQTRDPEATQAPLEHYLRIGSTIGLSPHPLFDPAWYLAQTGDPEARQAPLLHYLRTGAPEGLSPHPLFDPKFYVASGPELQEGVNPLVHHLADPQGCLRPPHPLFDPLFYLEHNPDLAGSRVHPLRHYVVHGGLESRQPHPLFDIIWYRKEYPDTVDWGNPVLHYLAAGALNGYSPHPLFDPPWYLSQTQDPEARRAPLAHYIATGSKGGLSPHPLFDPAWYRRTQLGSDDDETEPLGHFLTRGDPAGLDPNPLFSTAWYRAQYPDIAQSGRNALLHYLLHGAAERRDPHPAFRSDDYMRRNPTAVQTNGSALAHALVRHRPGFAQLIGFASTGAKLGGKAVDDSARSSSQPRFTDIPHHRRHLANIVAQESDEETARRIVGYFGIIEGLSPESTAGEARRQILTSLTERMRFLAAQAKDDRPIEATVIVPSYNHVEYTIACVISLLEHKSNTRFEIIIGNNISADETKEVFESVGGVLQCVTHAVNEGFIRNCNLSALHAKGKYIVLLNNDTIIFDRWLDELLMPFERFKDVGLTGSKLINADGTLQEAGAILWRDASGWNFGRNQDLTLPEFNYVKDIDWISGASIAIPTAVWNENGGFDERYVPAYCDDSDLAFALRAKGLRTILSPTSMLVHHEGITHGTDTNVGIKAYQVENQKKFVEKWQEVLQAEQYPNGEDVFLARDKSGRKPHMLVVDHYVPQFDKDAGSRTIYEYCRMFADAGIQVTFWPDNLYYDRSYTRELQKLGIEVLYGPQYVDQFSAWIEKNGKYLDYILLSRPHVMQNYIDAAREHSKAKVIFYGHDLHFARVEREYKATGREELLAELDHWRKLETAMWGKSDIIMYPAADEVEFVAREMPKKTVRLLTPYMYPDEEIEAIRAEVQRDAPAPAPSLLFVGGYRHRPNVDAAIWLVRQILPLVRREFPDIVTVVAGSFPPPEVTSLADDNVVVTGYVSDPLLQRLYKSSSVAVAPLRFGGGVKGKIIEALRFGVPLVTTMPGIQGVDGAEEFAEIGDTAADFAKGILRLLTNSDLRRRRVLRGLDFISREYAYRSVARRLAADLPEVARVAEGRGILQ